MIKRKFSLPYTPGIFGVLESMDVDSINDIYFSDNIFGSARAVAFDSKHLAELYSIRDAYGIKLHYLINGNYYSNEFYKDTSHVVDHIKSLDVDMLTLNNTYLMRDAIFMEELRKVGRKGATELEVKNSVNNIVKDVKDVKFMVETLGIKSIIVDRALNRNIDELTKIRTYCDKHGATITMLVNEGCIIDCKWKNFDDMMIAQTKPDSDIMIINFVHNKLGCTEFFERSPAEYLKTGFTLPTNLDKFDGLVDIIKLAGRDIPLGRWLVMCRAYMTEDGNTSLLNLLATKPASQIQQVTSNMLEETGFVRNTFNCKNVCGDECTLCDTTLLKLRKV